MIRIRKPAVHRIGPREAVQLEQGRLSVYQEHILIGREVGGVVPPRICFLPHDFSNEILSAKHFVQTYAHLVVLSVIEMYPYRTTRTQQLLHVQQPIAHHSEPHRVFEVILVTRESLGGVEGRVDVDQLDLTHVLFRQFRHAGQCFENVA